MKDNYQFSLPQSDALVNKPSMRVLVGDEFLKKRVSITRLGTCMYQYRDNGCLYNKSRDLQENML